MLTMAASTYFLQHSTLTTPELAAASEKPVEVPGIWNSREPTT
jgi:hypothetical protein